MPSRDQIIEAVMARALQADAVRMHPLLAWIVMRNQPEYPGEFVARLVTNAPTPYVLLADTLAGLQAQLPTDLVRSDRQPADPPKVVEIWFLR
jgi:hypothetical protein